MLMICFRRTVARLSRLPYPIKKWPSIHNSVTPKVTLVLFIVLAGRYNVRRKDKSIFSDAAGVGRPLIQGRALSSADKSEVHHALK